MSSRHSGEGTGTASVRNIAAQYNGIADFNYKSGVFYASAFLNPGIWQTGLYQPDKQILSVPCIKSANASISFGPRKGFHSTTQFISHFFKILDRGAAFIYIIIIYNLLSRIL